MSSFAGDEPKWIDYAPSTNRRRKRGNTWTAEGPDDVKLKTVAPELASGRRLIHLNRPMQAIPRTLLLLIVFPGLCCLAQSTQPSVAPPPTDPPAMRPQTPMP